MVLMISTLLICITIAIISYLYFRFVVKQTPKPLPIPAVDFEKDILFLNFIIKHKIKQHELFIFNPRQVTTAQFQGDEEFNKYLDQIIIDVYNSLSESYKKTLDKYFSKEGLLVFITEETMKYLTALMAGQNFDKVKKRNAAALTRTIFGNYDEKNNKGK